MSPAFASGTLSSCLPCIVCSAPRRSETLRERVVDRRVGADFAADDFEHIDAPGKRVGNRAEAIGRERLAA